MLAIYGGEDADLLFHPPTLLMEQNGYMKCNAGINPAAPELYDDAMCW